MSEQLPNRRHDREPEWVEKLENCREVKKITYTTPVAAGVKLAEDGTNGEIAELMHENNLVVEGGSSYEDTDFYIRHINDIPNAEKTETSTDNAKTTIEVEIDVDTSQLDQLVERLQEKDPTPEN
jgi:hypothetical protein